MILSPEGRFVRKPENVGLSINSKESYEVLTELFLGNDLYEQDKAIHDVKMMKIVDLI